MTTASATRDPEVIMGGERLPTTSDRPGGVSPMASVLEQSAIAELKIAAQVAKMFPRSIAQVRQTLLDACLRPGFAKVARYAKPVGGGKTSRGLSIRFAEEAHRAMGNLRVTEMPIYEDEDVSTIILTAWDCETMSHSAKAVTIRKEVERSSAADRVLVGPPEGRKNSNGSKVFLVKATEDEMLVKEAAISAKVRRNLILSLLPSDIREECEQLIADTIANKDAEDPKAAMKEIIDGLHRLNIRAVSVEQWLGHTIEESSPAEIQALREVYVSVRDGEASFAEHLAQKRQEREEGEMRAARGPSQGDATGVQQQSRARQHGVQADPGQAPAASAAPAAPSQPAAPAERSAPPAPAAPAAAAGAPTPPPPTDDDAPQAATSTARKSRGRRGANAEPPAPGQIEAATAKDVKAFLSDIKSATKADDELVALVVVEVFDGLEVGGLAGIPLPMLTNNRDKMVARVTEEMLPMGGEASDELFDAIVAFVTAEMPDATEEERDNAVQDRVDGICIKFNNAKEMDELPRWASRVWKSVPPAVADGAGDDGGEAAAQ